VLPRAHARSINQRPTVARRDLRGFQGGHTCMEVKLHEPMVGTARNAVGPTRLTTDDHAVESIGRQVSRLARTDGTLHWPSSLAYCMPISPSRIARGGYSQ